MARAPVGSGIYYHSRKTWLKEEVMWSRLPKRLSAVGLAGLLVVGLAAWPTAEDPPRFSDWSAPVNLGPTVNQPVNSDAGAFISKDGLSLFFGAYDRPDGYGQFDIYVVHRESVDGPWGPPQNVGPYINTSANEQTPALSIDGHVLYFASDRQTPEAQGSMDIYAARRHDKRDNLNWFAPENLGSGVNSAASDAGPAYFADDATGAVMLSFGSNRPGGVGGLDIYTSLRLPDGTFGPAAIVPVVNTTFNDQRPAIRRDGLELIFDSTRTLGSVGGTDLWVATRSSTDMPWSAPVNLGAVVNTAAGDHRPSISWDGTELYLHSFIEGGGDLFRCTRAKIRGRDKK